MLCVRMVSQAMANALKYDCRNIISGYLLANAGKEIVL